MLLKKMKNYTLPLSTLPPSVYLPVKFGRNSSHAQLN